jgi:hypothetical protein
MKTSHSVLEVNDLPLPTTTGVEPITSDADEPRLYQRIRQKGQIDDRTFEIELLDSGVQAVVFTFG